jgi:RHS repeat-associated protein
MARLGVLVSLLACFMVPSLGAQVTNVTNDQATPAPGVGHDYIQALNETVSPGNGSLSLRIQVPLPAARGLSLPFSIDYNSNGVIRLYPLPQPGPVGAGVLPNADKSFAQQGGWAYGLPMLTSAIIQIPANPTYPPGFCPVATGYVFTDSSGTRHAMQLALANQGTCNALGVIPQTAYGPTGDGLITAWTQNGAQDARNTPYYVRDPSGTLYHFPYFNAANGCDTGNCFIPDYIEDRNGNKITVTQGNVNTNYPITVKDTAGRNALSISGFGTTGNTITATGMAPYVITWQTGVGSFNISGTAISNSAPCAPFNNPHGTGPAKVISKITLPNGKFYQLFYDSTYGLVNKIVYPAGAYIRYQWGTNVTSDIVTYPGSNPPGGTCASRYNAPAIIHRYVSYDGVTEVQQQDFYYSTTWSTTDPNSWTTKTTRVTTIDLLLSQRFDTIYTYQPTSVSDPPNITSRTAGQVPLEQSVAYKDWTGILLKTVTKTWAGLYFLSSEQVTLGSAPTGPTAKVAYTYTGPEIHEKFAYDFGSGAPGPLIRKTTNNYQSFAVTPLSTYILDRPCQTVVSDSGGSTVFEADFFYDNGSVLCGATPNAALPGTGSYTNHDESLYGPSATVPRGNLTKKTTKCFVGASVCTNATISYTYDETGQVLSSTDPCGNATCADMTGANHATTYSYADNFASGTGTPPGQTNAYLTQVTYPNTGVAHVEHFSWGYSDGQLRSSTDQSGQTTSYQYSDPLVRLTQATYPDLGQTSITYDDSSFSASNNTPNFTTTRKITASVNLVSTEAGDGMWHRVRSLLTSDPDGTDTTDTTYDGVGRLQTLSNPHRAASSLTDGTATYNYDALGRVTSLLEQDGSTSTTSYSGNCTTVTDEAGKARKSCTDGLGRLTQLFEDPTSLNYETDYTYDTLNNLTRVDQKGSAPTDSTKWRTRTFQYDSLSRLTSSSNPESGNITYAYDANGNVASRVAPQPNQTNPAVTQTISYCYDTLNRITGKAYGAQTCPLSSPAASYFYDQTSYNGLAITNPLGRRTGMSDGSGQTAWSYDSMGRVAAVRRKINGISNTATYAYTPYLNGAVANLTYFSGSQVAYTYNGAGQALTAIDPYPINFVKNAHYTPAGALASAAFGAYNTGFTGTAVSNTYTNRLQPSVISASSPTMTVFSLSYSFNQGTPSAPKNNGNVVTIQNNRDNNRTQNFTYDALNRVATGYSSGPNWGETFTIDAWGNLTNRGPVTGKTTYEPLSTSATTLNRLTGFGYDAAGNMTSNGSAAYVYDAENRLITAGGMNYVYDGDGNRVKKYSGSTGTLYWPGKDNEILNESDLGASTWKRFVFFNGKMVARRDSSTGNVYYFYSDHLGSMGVITDSLGQTIENESDYYPYGGERVVTSVLSDEHYKFTGKERDAESSLDNFGKRYDASSLGRFMTTDPVVITTERLTNPQQLNLYAYVANNPLRFIDPTGEILQCVGTTDQQKQCFAELQQIAGDAAKRLSMDAKTGVVGFDATGLDLGKNDGAALVNDLVGSKNTYDFSIGPTVMTDKGPVKIDYIEANLPSFGDQPKNGNPPPGVNDIVALYFNNPNVTRASNTNLKVAPEWTIAFHELAEAYEKIDGGKGGSYAAGHNAALQRELELRDQRPYLKEYNTGAGGPANSPNPEGKIIIKQ